jgi:transposase
MFNKSNPTVATMGIDIGKNSFHVVGLDQRGAIVLRQKWSRRQIVDMAVTREDEAGIALD